jgi:oligoribonuclease
MDNPIFFDQPLLWIDLEMTGLNPDSDTILEIAFILSDGELKNLKEGPELILKAS